MIKLTFAHLIDQNFTNGLMALGSWSGCQNVKTKLAIGNMIKEYSAQAFAVDKKLQELIDAHCEKNEDGSRKAQKDRPGTFIIPDENEAAWNEAVKAVAMELPCRQLVLSELSGVPLTPIELSAIDALINENEITKLKAKA